MGWAVVPKNGVRVPYQNSAKGTLTPFSLRSADGRNPALNI